MIPPGTWAAASSSLASALLLRESRCSIPCTRKPPSLHWRDVCHDGFGFPGWRGGIGLRLLLRQLTRMPHHKTERRRGDPSSAVLDLPLADDTLPMPVSGCFCLRPPWFLHQQGPGGWLLPPRFECLAHGTRTWN
jgi:hypothetical protein